MAIVADKTLASRDESKMHNESETLSNLENALKRFKAEKKQKQKTIENDNRIDRIACKNEIIDSKNNYFYSSFVRTNRTGVFAILATSSATLPIRKRLNPRLP